jgi:hypothetical protein
MAKVNRILKGLCASFVMGVCLSMTSGSGGSLNPAFGLAQSTYMVGLMNRNGSDAGTQVAQYMWVYIVMPFIGAAFAALIYLFHQTLDPKYVPPHAPLIEPAQHYSQDQSSIRNNSDNDPSALLDPAKGIFFKND